MFIDQAITNMEIVINGVSASAEIKSLKISEEEARLTMLVPAGEIQTVKDAAFQPMMDALIEGLDIQVLVYDKDNPTQVV